MKVASRFPVKPCTGLLWLIIGGHIVSFVLATIGLHQWWVIALFAVIFAVSAFYSHIQYQRVTSAGDDLCWSGDAWLMHLTSGNKGINYFNLKISSWVTSYFCLLKFDSNGKEQVWLFTRNGLGERSFRELCYLVKKDIKLTRKLYLKQHNNH